MAVAAAARRLEQPRQTTRRKTSRRRRPQPRRASTFSLFLSVVFLITFLASVNVTFQGLIAQDSLHLAKIEELLQSEKEKNERLKVEILKLKSPQYLEEVARVELGMVEPEKVRYIILPSDLKAEEGIEYAVKLSKNDELKNKGFFSRIFNGITGE